VEVVALCCHVNKLKRFIYIGFVVVCRLMLGNVYAKRCFPRSWVPRVWAVRLPVDVLAATGAYEAAGRGEDE